jgi:hypothetical protein
MKAGEVSVKANARKILKCAKAGLYMDSRYFGHLRRSLMLRLFSVNFNFSNRDLHFDILEDMCNPLRKLLQDNFCLAFRKTEIA